MSPNLKIYPPATDHEIRLMQERWELYQDYVTIGSLIERIRILKQHIATMQEPVTAGLEKALEALEPFARAAGERQVMCDDTERVTWSAITVGDLRRAASALAALKWERPK
ncbi:MULTISPECIES: hypothetical protein [unclassified Phyllobacterium]|uniref:hypothetical protein n=1 Tax=unclassified Phyllobacterium TaxID=2638441 RepID=UPI003012FE26